MKKNFKLTTIIACVAMFIASLILSISFYTTPVYAAGSVFEMEYGASVKLSENGLRFTAKMDKAYRDMIVNNDNVELWGYIAPTEEFDKVTAYSDLTVKVGGNLDESKIYQASDGYYHANLVITGLDNKKSGGKYLYGISFSAIVFIKDKTTNTIIYADMAKGENGVSDIALQNRTQYQVVNAAMLDGDESYEEAIMEKYSWYGSSEYPILLDSEEDIDAFASKLSNDSFKQKIDGKSVFVSNELKDVVEDNAIISGTDVTVASGHKVSFWDGNKLLKTEYVEDGASATNFTPTRAGYDFVAWTGASLSNVTGDIDLYAKWKSSKGNPTDIGNLSVYGLTRADGAEIKSDADVIGSKVVLASGVLGDGAYYPGETNSVPDPTDEKGTADQAYLAFDGNYGFGDYFVADFTGKNMPTLAFFANGYDKSIFYGNGTKNGVVVATGLTWPDGRTFAEGTAYCTSVFNGQGLCMWGPHMIYSTAKNNNPSGVLLHSSEENVALGRANLVAGKQYRIIMGFEPGDDASNKAIKLVYTLYDLDNDCIVESRAINTYNFFADGWANAGQTRDQFCQGSIVAYGYFGTTTVLDKVYDIYEDTSIDAISRELGMASVYKTTINGDSIVLENGTIGAGASYTIGQNAGGSIDQAYYAINGSYSLNDYVAFDFTGKNMPEVAFFAKNYNASMYAEGDAKRGIVVASGITLWNGEIGDAQSNNTQVAVSGPFGAYFEGAAAPHGGNMMNAFASMLARANLVDGTHYRVIMGITEASDWRGITLNYCLYDLDTGAIVEQNSMSSWNFYDGSNTAVGGLTRDQLVGSIVLYGKFGTTCTIDKLHGVFENATIEGLLEGLEGNARYTVTFKDADGNVLETVEDVAFGEFVSYSGEMPTPPASTTLMGYSYVWDKAFGNVYGDVVYTLKLVATANAGYKTYNVTEQGDAIVLGAGSLGDGANYTKGQNNGGYVDQAYLGIDGNYALNNYIVFDFTGKNMPEVAFFASNYNNSMYAEGTSKQGIVVVTGITSWNGQEIINVNSDKPAGGVINYGFPYMVEDASNGGFCEGAHATSALGRANLVDGKHYRVIMGFTGSGNTITLHWCLYDLDTNSVVEQSSMTTWGFFSGSNDQVGKMTINDLVGSIVLYGKFGTTCTIDKLHGVVEGSFEEVVASYIA